MSAAAPLSLGIDPGSTTGLARADGSGALVSVASAGPLATLRELDGLAASGASVSGVWIEDSRGLPIYARNRHASRGERDAIARSVGHTDFLTGFYAALCASHGWAVHLVEPKRAKKWDAGTLARLTGWTARTNEHARDAARLVFGRTARGEARGATRGQQKGNAAAEPRGKAGGRDPVAQPRRKGEASGA